ncbi:MAG: hypothetical protein M1543_02885 [Firmicutes bacterium]|nr:hypothetical protein [Bacillota bacterium]
MAEDKMVLNGARKLLREKFRYSPGNIPDKVCSLSDAIKKNVRPGMALHLVFTTGRWPNAAIYEIIRQFWNTRPGFTLISLTASGPVTAMVHGGLAEKIITSYTGDSYYAVRPNAAHQRAYENKEVVYENWSLLTFILRLMAGAMGLPFLPARSLAGSTMAEDNREKFVIAGDPFGTDEKVGLVKALVPDLSIVHALAADQEGNALFFPPYAENLYGAAASRNGVILTAEKIVPPETIRRYSYLVKLPAQYVASVSEAPFGAHPGGITNNVVPGIQGYIEDYDFFNELHEAARDREKFDDWIGEWVLDCCDHRDYLRKLGSRRMFYLQGKSGENSWMLEEEELLSCIDLKSKANHVETAIIAASRKLAELVKKGEYKTVLAGAGLANLAASMAYYKLREEGYPVELMVEMGLYGYAPRPLDPMIMNFRNHPACKMLTDAHWIMGVAMGGRNNRCIGCLGAALVDRSGNINSTLTGSHIGGSGGANDIASMSKEVMVLAIQSPQKFVENVSYITSPGDKVRTLISTLGVFEKLGLDEEFTLTGYFPGSSFASPEENISHVMENCGWKLKVARDINKVPLPSSEELMTLRLLDPQRYYLGKNT